MTRPAWHALALDLLETLHPIDDFLDRVRAVAAAEPDGTAAALLARANGAAAGSYERYAFRLALHLAAMACRGRFDAEPDVWTGAQALEMALGLLRVRALDLDTQPRGTALRAIRGGRA